VGIRQRNREKEQAFVINWAMLLFEKTASPSQYKVNKASASVTLAIVNVPFSLKKLPFVGELNNSLGALVSTTKE
jgi:hypothetical protein